MRKHSTHWIYCLPTSDYFLNGPTPATFRFYFRSFQTNKQFLQQINVKNVMSIQYAVPGFEPITKRQSSPITSRTGLSSDNFRHRLMNCVTVYLGHRQNSNSDHESRRHEL